MKRKRPNLDSCDSDNNKNNKCYNCEYEEFCPVWEKMYVHQNEWANIRRLFLMMKFFFKKISYLENRIKEIEYQVLEND